MSFGFSIGDILASIKLLNSIYQTCFSNVSNTRLAYFSFGEQVKGLAEQLDSLYNVLSDNEARQLRRQRQHSVATLNTTTTVPLRGSPGYLNMREISSMIGDFQRTIERTNDLLIRGNVFKRKGGYINRIIWSLTLEEEVHRLSQDCQFHMTKIQFVIKTLELRLLGQLSDQIDDAHASLMNRLHDLEERLLNALGATSPVNNYGSPPPTYPNEDQLSSLMAHDRVMIRFENSLKHHPRFRSVMSEIPVEEWTEAAAWWIERAKSVPLRSHEVPADWYLNLLKAAWLLRRVEETVGFRRLEPNSLWIAYICTLSESIVKELTLATSATTGDRFSLPDEETLLKLPTSMFSVWLNSTPTESILTIHDERPGEEKLLELSLELESRLNPERFARKLLVFRKDATTLRLCDSTENLENGATNAEEFIVLTTETEFLALYITPIPYRATSPYTIWMRNRLQCREYTFMTLQDLHSFQRAITAFQPAFFPPQPLKLIAAPTRSATFTAHSQLQIWIPKPLTPTSPSPGVLQPPTSSPLARAQTSNTIASTTSAYAASVVTTTSTISSSSSNSPSEIAHVISLSLPQSPILSIFLYTPANGWQLLSLPIDETFTIATDRCCGNRLHSLLAPPSSSKKSRSPSITSSTSSFSSSSGPPQPLCCLRTVIESSTRGNLQGKLYDSVSGGEFGKPAECGKGEAGVLDMLKMGRKGEGRKVEYKYVALEFGGEEEKRVFLRAVEGVVMLREAKRRRVLKEVGREVGGLKSGWKG